MTNRKLAVLGIVAAGMLVWAVVQHRVSKMKSPARIALKDSYLIQGLDTSKIAGVVIGKGANPIRLKRQNTGFVVASKDGYPALTSKINNLITSLLDIRIIELVTDNPDYHESLSVTEEKSQNVIKFLDKDDKVITGIIVGTTRFGQDMAFDTRSTYVRLISDNRVYLANDVPLSGGSSTDYIDKELVNLKDSDIVKVTVTSPERSYTLRIEDSNDTDVVLVGKPADRKQKDYDCKQVFRALMSLTFSDVMKDASAPDLKFDHKYVCELKDKRIYTFDVAKKDDKTYVKCAATYTGEVPKKERRVESPEELKAKESKLVAWDQAETFTKKCSGWVYEIPSWKAGSLTKSFADLLEEPKEEKDKKEQAKASDAIAPATVAKKDETPSKEADAPVPSTVAKKDENPPKE